MRKLYWGCAAAGLAALGFIHAANYAWQHPDTVVGICLDWTYRSGLNFGPICRAGLYLVDRVNARSGEGEEELAEIPEEPEPIAIEEPCPSGLENANAINDYFGWKSADPQAKAEVVCSDEPERGRLDLDQLGSVRDFQRGGRCQQD